LCDQTDDNIHFARCSELQNDLKNSLFEVVEKCPIIREKNCPTLASLIKNTLVQSFNVDTIFGFIPKEITSLWEEYKFDKKELARFGKNMLKAMHQLWKKRCSRNQIRYERSLQVPIQNVPNNNRNLQFYELTKLSSHAIVPKNLSCSGIYWCSD